MRNGRFGVIVTQTPKSRSSVLQIIQKGSSMLKTITLTIATILVSMSVYLFGGTISANACGQSVQVACGNTAPDKHVSGNKQIKNPIKVTICHTYWNRLDVGILNGRKTKWWGPTIRYGSWSMDLKATASQCKSWWVVPGTVIDSYANCVQRIVTTSRMYKSGTYWLT